MRVAEIKKNHIEIKNTSYILIKLRIKKKIFIFMQSESNKNKNRINSTFYFMFYIVGCIGIFPIIVNGPAFHFLFLMKINIHIMNITFTQ